MGLFLYMSRVSYFQFFPRWFYEQDLVVTILASLFHVFLSAYMFKEHQAGGNTKNLKHYSRVSSFRSSSNTVPVGRKVPQKGKIVHIHGTNGAKFNGLNYVTTTAQAYMNDPTQNGNW